eukprot:753105-Hanusia_phi.AAC.1
MGLFQEPRKHQVLGGVEIKFFGVGYPYTRRGNMQHEGPAEETKVAFGTGGGVQDSGGGRWLWGMLRWRYLVGWSKGHEQQGTIF